MANLWCPFARRIDGPASKQGYTGAESPPGSPKTGMVWHSAEGWAQGLLSVLDGPRRASWAFSGLLDGTLWQHYPVHANLWHCGDVYRNENLDVEGELAGNIDLIGIEYEGLTGQPLTDNQYDTGIRLYRWLSDELGWGPASRDGTYPEKTLWEHREVSDAGTSCPSDRIDWERVLRGVTDMPEKTLTREQVILFIKAEGKAMDKARLEWLINAFRFVGWEPPSAWQMR